MGGSKCSGTSIIDSWYYFNLSIIPPGFVFADSSPFDILVTIQGPLSNITPPFEILNIATAVLPAGTYTFYFAVDSIVNDTLDFDKLTFDLVKVVVP